MSVRIDEARRVALSLLDDLEGAALPIDGVLMKAKRLARLMRDSDAQSWLDLETRGYPAQFHFSELGACQKYAASCGRIDSKEGTYYRSSLPEFEAAAEADSAIVESFRAPRSPVASVKNFGEKNASAALMADELRVQKTRRNNYAASKARFSSIKSSIHSYAVETYLAIELGDVAEDIFEGARNEVDAFVRSHCPKAAEKLISIKERMTDKTSESRAAALTSCRRLLAEVADSLFPPSGKDWTDAKGKSRKVGVEQYKNRLLAYITESIPKSGSREVIEVELGHLADRLDAIYDKACKGVHADVSEQEARLAVIHTYLFIAEVAKYTTISK